MMEPFFNKSVCICAHPDDEILWFSSILRKVDLVVVCFLRSYKYTDLTMSRIKIKNSYPLKNVVMLDFKEAGVWKNSDWENRICDRYGVKFNNRTISSSRRFLARIKYIVNYHRIFGTLRGYIKEYSNIFTHSPWGEYGHEEHVQIYRIVSSLLDRDQKQRLFFPCSFHSKGQQKQALLKGMEENGACSFSIRNDSELFQELKGLYIDNNAWTYDDDFEPPALIDFLELKG